MRSFAHPTDSGLRWTLHASCPADWRYSLSRFGGKFFHTSRGLALTAPRGEVTYCELRDEREVVGMAAGVRYSVGESGAPRHLYFATVPALSCHRQRDAAVAALLRDVAAEGVTDVVIDSLDASWVPGAVAPLLETRHRREYVVDLEPSLMAMLTRCAPIHKRRIEQYAAAGWRVRRLAGNEVHAVLAALQVAEAHRAPASDAFAHTASALVPTASSRLTEDAGSVVYAAFDGGLPVAASLVGWSGHRAYHVHGGAVSGSDPADCELYLQWKIMRELAVSGFVSYNLGGLPARAVDPSHQLSPVHRIRMGFGPRVEECLSIRLTLEPRPVAAVAHYSDGTPWRTSGESWQH